MIDLAFCEFLTANGELEDETRQEGREELRRLVGEHVYDGREPRGDGAACITIQEAGGEVHSSIKGPSPIRSPNFRLHVWTRDDEDNELSGSEVKGRIIEALRKLLPQYRGPFNDSISVQTISQLTEPTVQMETPLEAQDDWTYHTSILYMIGYLATVPTGAH